VVVPLVLGGGSEACLQRESPLELTGVWQWVWLLVNNVAIMIQCATTHNVVQNNHNHNNAQQCHTPQNKHSQPPPL
jgi:hypothetical protein